MLKYQLGEHRMKKFKDYFQNKIDKVPTWLAELRKLKKKKADLDGDPVDNESGDHSSTERLGDGEDGKVG